MNIDTSKYQANIIVTDAESWVKSHALEDATIPDSLGFIIKPSSSSSTSSEEESNGGKAAKSNQSED